MKILIVTVSAEMEMKRKTQIQFLIGDIVQLIEENWRKRVKVFLNFIVELRVVRGVCHSRRNSKFRWFF